MSDTTLKTPVEPEGSNRRDVLYIASGAVGAIGAVLSLWPFVNQMNPDAQTLAAGRPIDVDLTKLAPGQQITVVWRDRPILITRRTPALLKVLQEPKLIEILSDPKSEANQQPPYAQNWHRSAKPEYGVLVGICTHLGCIPEFFPQPNKTQPTADWPGGYFCPCHGSKYDLAGRVYSGVPAPYNLPVPPYYYVNDTTLRIGENPPNVSWQFTSVIQV